ncbi:hypothetical protein N7G274_010404 [Stereocaulon virgatum]|uniref:Uncharacterized protein n=1 Tax=Stereocaulon virgatum TaxID=373712 RepID=A0ABR3ZW29_9LECA
MMPPFQFKLSESEFSLAVAGNKINPALTHPNHFAIAQLRPGRNVALREPDKFYAANHLDRKLVEGLLINSRGQKSIPSCNKCERRLGPFEYCVSVRDKGVWNAKQACRNCVRGGRGQECSLSDAYVGDGILPKAARPGSMAAKPVQGTGELRQDELALASQLGVSPPSGSL